MEKWLGGILVDVSPPERAKFKAPLIFVHGAWTSSRCWRRWATHFSNLGWECWAVNFRGRFEKNAAEVLQQVSFEDCAEDLKQVIRAAEFPPVVVAHDLGARVALQAAAEERTSALALLAALPPSEAMPEPPRPLRLMRLKYAPLVFLRRPFSLDEKDFRKNWLNALPPADHPEALRSLVPESPELIREFFDRRAGPDAVSARAPVFIAAAREDRVAPADSLRRFAQRIGAEFREYPGHGHWIMGEDDGEKITRDIHRWIVQQSGGELLVEEDNPQ